MNTKIEWTERVWNPTTGCDRVSPGCDRCYALTMAKRLKGMGSAKYQNDGDPRTSGPGFGLTVHPSALRLPLTWRKPQRIFVNSMSDLFHEQVPDEFIARVFAVMAQADQHTFQLLTKRHGRMRSLLSSPQFAEAVDREWCDILDWYDGRIREDGWRDNAWPLPNVHLIVSVEDQKRADLRIPALLDTPAAVRGLSCEPLLGPVDLSRWQWCNRSTGQLSVPTWCRKYAGHDGSCDYSAGRPQIDWVIVGGESGRGARPMHPDWARSLRDQCRAAGVPFLFKQWGEHAPRCKLALCGHPCSCNGVNASHPIEMRRVGKKAAGRELDGRTWDEYPQAVTA